MLRAGDFEPATEAGLRVEIDTVMLFAVGMALTTRTPAVMLGVVAAALIAVCLGTDRCLDLGVRVPVPDSPSRPDRPSRRDP